jgi:hypothetical protein
LVRRHKTSKNTACKTSLQLKTKRQTQEHCLRNTREVVVPRVLQQKQRKNKKQTKLLPIRVSVEEHLKA